MPDDTPKKGKVNGATARVMGGRYNPANCGPDGKHIPAQTAGRKGGLAKGRNRLEARAIPPASQAIPAPARGRPTDCTPEKAKEFARYFATGIGMTDAAWASGLYPQLVAEWFNKAEEGREPYRSFAELAMVTFSQAKGGAADTARQEQPLHWLERVDRRWSPKANLEITSGGEGLDLVKLLCEWTGDDPSERDE